MVQRLSEEGAKFIGAHEGVKTRAYIDPTGTWTIGIGHTSAAGPPEVVSGLTLTLDQVYELFRTDVRKFEKYIHDGVIVPLTQTQFDALVSFVYNVGPGNFNSSTLLKKLNQRDYLGAAEEFKKWNKSKGRVLPGLTRRRAEERALFLDGEFPADATPTRPFLQIGSRGDDVRRLQELLIAKGYIIGSGGADGIFGRDTEKAVKKFQRDHNLLVDGKAGDATLSELERDLREEEKEFTPAEPAKPLSDYGIYGLIGLVLTFLFGWIFKKFKKKTP